MGKHETSRHLTNTERRKQIILPREWNNNIHSVEYWSIVQIFDHLSTVLISQQIITKIQVVATTIKALFSMLPKSSNQEHDKIAYPQVN